MLGSLRSFLPYHVYGEFRARRLLYQLREREARLDADDPEARRLRDLIAHLESLNLLCLHNKYLHLSPDVTVEDLIEEAKWRISPYLEEDQLILTPEARAELQSAIRAARKDYLETWRLWITAVGVVIALLALILGQWGKVK
jgi:type II secretory pathway component PulL